MQTKPLLLDSVLVAALALLPPRDALGADVPQAPGSDVHLPIVVRGLANNNKPLVNGDCESGPTGWAQSSTSGYDLITQTFDGTVTAHSGSWSAWLGGAYYETSTLRQQVTVPPGSRFLVYWPWIGSTDSCGYDFAWVLVNEAPVDGRSMRFTQHRWLGEARRRPERL